MHPMSEARLLPLSERFVGPVVRAMRVDDRREVFATRFDDDPEALVRDLVAASRFGVVLARGAVPAVAMGAVECWPGVWSAWLIATDDWKRVARDATRYARIAVLSVLARAGAHRCECRSIEGHHVAHRWLRHLGAREEATHRGFGRNKETFITFVWRLDHVHALGTETQGTAAPAAPR